MEIAVERDNFEVLIILAGFAEVSADMKLDFLGMILENEGDENYSAEFKKNLEGLSVPEVRVNTDFDVFHCSGVGKAAKVVVASQM